VGASNDAGGLCNTGQTQPRFVDTVGDMRTVISQAAVAVPAPANVFANRFGALAAGTVSSRETPRVWTGPAAPSVAGAGLKRGLRRVLTALGGFGEILVLAYAFPLAILAIGIPIALFVRLVMWIVRGVVA
jgi:hypothetical protein